MTGADYFIASMASVVGIGSAIAAIRLPKAAFQWNVASQVHRRWGNRGVRIFYWLLTLLMALAVFFIIFPLHRRKAENESSRLHSQWIAHSGCLERRSCIFAESHSVAI